MSNWKNEKGLYIRLEDFKGGMEVQRKKVKEALNDSNCRYYYEASQLNFSKIPGSPVAYWVAQSLLTIFESEPNIGKLADVRIGMGTGNNDLFLREWWEVNVSKIGFEIKNVKEADLSEKNIFLMAKEGTADDGMGIKTKLYGMTQMEDWK